MLDLVNGLKYIHSIQILHRDLKPENIFIRDNDDLVIGDFGYAVESSIIDYRRLGTVNFMAPELYIKIPPYYSYKSDIYALGCIFYEMYDLNVVHKGHDQTIKKKIISNEPLIFERIEKIERLEKLINRMTEYDHHMRIDLLEVEKELNIIKNMNIFTYICNSPSPSPPSYSSTNKFIAISENRKKTKDNNISQPYYYYNTNTYNNKYSSTAPLPSVPPLILNDNNNMNKTLTFDIGVKNVVVKPTVSSSPLPTRIIEGYDVYLLNIF